MATGVSVEGIQILLDLNPAAPNIFMSIDGSFPTVAKYQAFVSLEMLYDSTWHQIDGRSLYYQGVWFQTPFAGFFPIRLVANWREAGIAWTATTL